MEYVRSGPWVMLESALWLGVSVLAFHGAGAFLIGRCFGGGRVSEVGLRKIFAQALGLFFFSLWLFAWGALGFLNRGTVIAFLAAGVLLCIRDKRRHFAAEMAAAKKTLRAGWPLLGAAALVFLPALLSYIAAQAPAVGNDALSYHFYLPKLFVSEGRVFYDPNHARSLWPFLMEMTFAAALLLQGTALAQSYGWWVTVLAVLAVPVAVQYFSRDRTAALASAALIGLVPAVWMQSFCGNVDNAMMLYTFLSFVALWVWMEKGLPRGSLVAGLCLGALLSVKIYAIVPFILLLSIFFSLLILRRHAFSSPKSLVFGLWSLVFVFSLGTILGGFWYFRSWFYTGNPFFPFFGEWFGGWGYRHNAVGYAELPKTVWHLLSVPWNVSMRPDVYGGEPIGCFYLAALPLLVFVRRANAIVIAALSFAALYTVLWFYSIQHIRFFFPALPFLSLSFGALAARGFGTLIFPVWQKAAVSVLFGLHAALAAYYPALVVPAALGAVDAGRYVGSCERTYKIMKRIGDILKPGEKVLFTLETRLFYSPVEAIDLSPAVDLQCKRRGISLDEWAREEGITHILTTDPDPSRKYPFLFLGDYRTIRGSFTEIFSQAAEQDGAVLHYSLWRVDFR